MFRTPQNSPEAELCLQLPRSQPPQGPAGRTRLRVEHLGKFALLPFTNPAAKHEIWKFDPVEHYWALFLAALMVIGITIVLYSLIRYRGKAVGPVSWGVLILGTGILPIFVSSAGGVLVFQRSQQVEMCNSCHLTMKRYVDDMKNPASKSLAAVHYANRYIEEDQCYRCHTSYGMFGTVQAKREGLVDVYKYYTRSFSTPLKMRHPYSNNDCLKCHGESAKFLATHKHDREAMFADEVSCMQCHEDDNPAHNVEVSEKQ